MPNYATSIAPSRARRAGNATLVALACTLALGVSACRKRAVQASPPAGVPAPDSQPGPAKKPETRSKTPSETSPAPTPPPTLNVPPPKPAPSKPKPSTPDPKLPAPDPAPPKPAPPQISPRISPEEQAQAEKQTNEEISWAEQNLQKSYGKTLNAAQHDLVEKIHGFLGQAREALRASDWVRARNLAQKARVLSVELADSL